MRGPGACCLATLVMLAAPGAAQDPPPVIEAERRAGAAWLDALSAPLGGRLEAHDLRWVTEFEAGVLGAERFGAAAIPVDLSRLRYLGYARPGGTFPYEGVHALPPALTRPHHVYRYGERFAVLTASDGRRDQLIAFAALRALELLRARAPALHHALFVGPQTPSEQLARVRVQHPEKPVRFLNLTRAVAVVIDGGGPSIARSHYDLGTREPEAVTLGDERLDAVDVFRNVATIYLDRAAIEGHGSRALYGHEDLRQNFVRYLRDGLVETLVHEGLHQLLRRDKNVRDLFWAITTSVRELGGERLGMACEEAFVANVSSRALAGRGLDPLVTAYYQRMVAGTHRSKLGLAAGHETDGGAALRALLARHHPRPDAPFEELFWFDPLDLQPAGD